MTSLLSDSQPSYTQEDKTVSSDPAQNEASVILTHEINRITSKIDSRLKVIERYNYDITLLEEQLSCLQLAFKKLTKQ